ncbi:hypothetical protein scyTo_0001040 [Scyliorhinus torazame]|uniref:Uncharacterized protein n=1 Tax=Scyliorhinus torazame TaxID=75743 RepID=A0A401P873_SCYTO|nr:hypothetical protein [Scyliorhinus torazame]
MSGVYLAYRLYEVLRDRLANGENKMKNEDNVSLQTQKDLTEVSSENVNPTLELKKPEEERVELNEQSLENDLKIKQQMSETHGNEGYICGKSPSTKDKEDTTGK